MQCVYIPKNTELAAYTAIDANTIMDDLCLSYKHLLTLCPPSKAIQGHEALVSLQIVAQIKSRCFWNFPGQTDRETPGNLSRPEEEYLSTM
jgi:hypothetical protein